jgi:hypothetical protein
LAGRRGRYRPMPGARRAMRFGTRGAGRQWEAAEALRGRGSHWSHWRAAKQGRACIRSA